MPKGVSRGSPCPLDLALGDHQNAYRLTGNLVSHARPLKGSADFGIGDFDYWDQRLFSCRQGTLMVR